MATVLRGFFAWQRVWLTKTPPHCRDPQCRWTCDEVTDAPHGGRGYCENCFARVLYRERKAKRARGSRQG